MKLDTLSPEFKHSSRRGVDKGVNQAVSGGVDRGGNLGAQRSPKTSPATDAPSHDPNLPDNQAKTHWIEIVQVGEDGKPIPGEAYRITLPDGSTVADRTLDDKGAARVDNIDAGNCKVTFPNLDQDAWDDKR